jgi:hypothetical protein
LYVDVVGIAKIKIGDHAVFKVYYGGMWRGRPSLVVSIGARELGEVLRSSALWQNQWFDYVAKLSLRERAADEGRCIQTEITWQNWMHTTEKPLPQTSLGPKPS